MKENTTNTAVIGCAVLFLLAVLVFYFVAIVAVHYGLAQLFPNWEPWVLWVIAWMITSAFYGISGGLARSGNRK